MVFNRFLSLPRLTSSSSSVSCSVHSLVELAALAWREPTNRQDLIIQFLIWNVCFCSASSLPDRWPSGFSCCKGRGEGRSSAGRWTCLCLCLGNQPSAAGEESGQRGNHRERCLSCGFYLRFVSRTAQGLCSYRWGSVVQGNEARRSVSQHGEVGCGRGSHWQRATVGVHLVIHQTPLLQEGVDPDERETPAESVFWKCHSRLSRRWEWTAWTTPLVSNCD